MLSEMRSLRTHRIAPRSEAVTRKRRTINELIPIGYPDNTSLPSDV
jgi:hypothetical protein